MSFNWIENLFGLRAEPLQFLRFFLRQAAAAAHVPDPCLLEILPGAVRVAQPVLAGGMLARKLKDRGVLPRDEADQLLRTWNFAVE
jgi:hypothetical protein